MKAFLKMALMTPLTGGDKRVFLYEEMSFFFGIWNYGFPILHHADQVTSRANYTPSKLPAVLKGAFEVSAVQKLEKIF